MISHFQYKPKNPKLQMGGWTFSFFHKGIRYQGTYEKNGEIRWDGEAPPGEDEKTLKSHVHELMLYHVYED